MLTALELKLKIKEKWSEDWALDHVEVGEREEKIGQRRSLKLKDDKWKETSRRVNGPRSQGGKKYLKGMVMNWVRDYWYRVGESYDCSFDLIR